MTDQAPERVMKIYKPPFRYDRGYIFDADGHMVADDGAAPDELVAAAEIRGWGRIGYMGTYEEASKIQDDIGKHFAKALTQYWSGPAIPVAELLAKLDQFNGELNATFHDHYRAGASQLDEVIRTYITEYTNHGKS